MSMCRVAKALSLSLLVVVSSLVPASADEISQFLQDVSQSKTLDDQIAAMRMRVSAAQTAGGLSQERAVQIMHRLDALEQETSEGALRTGGNRYAQNMRIMQALQELASELPSQANAGEAALGGGNWNLGGGLGSTSFGAGISPGMPNEISADGVVTPLVSGDLPEDSSVGTLSAVVPLTGEVSRNRSGGVAEVTSEQHTVYSPMFNKVQTVVAPPLAVTNLLEPIKHRIKSRINSGLISGRITEQEAERIQPSIDALMRQENAFKLTGSGLSEAEQNNLARKYQMLDLALEDMMWNTDTNDWMPSAELRRLGMRRRIAYNLGAANLTMGEAQELLNVLDGIASNEALYHATGTVLSAEELEALHQDLYKLDRLLLAKTNGSIIIPRPLSTVDGPDLLKRIEMGVACGALSEQKAALLRSAYRKVALVEAALTGDGVLTPLERAHIAEQLDRLNLVADRWIAGSQVAAKRSQPTF